VSDVRVLLGGDHDLDDGALAAVYAYPTPLPATGHWLRANMVASVDGAVVGPDHRAGTLGTPADRRVFGLLRALSDAVVVGAGTVRVEGYGPARVRPALAALRAERGQRPVPAIVVVSRSLDLDLTSPLFTAAAERTVVVTGEASDPERRSDVGRVAHVVVAGETDVDLTAAVAALVERGLCRLLCEGGPTLLEQVVAAGLLDELCLTLAPLIVGGAAGRILHGPGPGPLGGGLVPLQLAQVLEEDGTLLTRWMRAG
jgi:riboflavin-specific deaminase-like protein